MQLASKNEGSGNMPLPYKTLMRLTKTSINSTEYNFTLELYIH